MIKSMEIKNFKSIKHLRLDCKRVNIFIGKPNTGKSNILETIGVFSFGYYNRYSTNSQLRDFVRFERVSYLFYDENLDEQIGMNFDNKSLKIRFRQGQFEGEWHRDANLLVSLYGSYDNLDTNGVSAELSEFKFYRFAIQNVFPRRESDFLLPPSGSNLLSLIQTHRELKSLANQIFSEFSLRLGLRPQENKIEVVKQIEDVIVSYPYSLTSDTLQRIVFYLSAVLSNRDSIIGFEEPESHSFPFYTKYLAETVALDDRNNQYFISTHNPYLLMPIVEKAPKEDVGVFITYFKDYQTKVKPLSTGEIEEITEIDVFSNLDRFLEVKEAK